MVFLNKKNKIFIYRLSLIVIIILKIKICIRIQPNKIVDRKVQSISYPLSHKLNCSINTFIKNNSQTNVMAIYGATQSGKSYLIDHIREELINLSYVPFLIKNVCFNNTNLTSQNHSIEIFVNNHTFQYDTKNDTLNKQIEALSTAFYECNSQNITQLLSNLSANNQVFITIHNYGQNGLINSNFTEKMTDLKNVSFIIESSNYSSFSFNNSNVTIINTEPINNSAFLLSKQYNVLSPQEAEAVEKLFGGHMGPISRIVNNVQKGEKVQDIIPAIEKEIYDNLSLIIDNFNSTIDKLDICNSSVKLSDMNSTHLNYITSLLENGFLYVNDSFVINFANPTVKKFICEKNEKDLNVTENITFQASNVTAEINQTDNFINDTSNVINATVTNETDNVTTSINETVNLANKTSNATIEINQTLNESANSINSTININGTADIQNETSYSANAKMNETENVDNETSNVKVNNNETVNLANETSSTTVETNETEKVNE